MRGMMPRFAMFALLLPAGAAGAQQISAITGTVSDGGIITIVGTGFGSKPTPSPYVWDQIDQPTPASKDDPATLGVWGESTCGDCETSTSNQRHPRTQYNVHADFNGSNSVALFDVNQGKTASTWYGEYWFYLGTDWHWCPFDGVHLYNLANVKFGARFYSTNNVDLAIASHTGDTIVTMENCSGSSPGYIGWDATQKLTPGVWHHIQLAFRAGAVNTPDGILRMWFDGKQEWSFSNITTNCSPGNGNAGFDMDGLGFYNSWTTTCGYSGSSTLYMDDFYVDTSWARVEVGDSSTYAGCTHREVQVPQTWSASVLTVKVNQGSFGDGASAYLFVVDATGTASPGFPIVFGGSPTPDAALKKDAAPPDAPATKDVAPPEEGRRPRRHRPRQGGHRRGAGRRCRRRPGVLSARSRDRSGRGGGRRETRRRL